MLSRDAQEDEGIGTDLPPAAGADLQLDTGGAGAGPGGDPRRRDGERDRERDGGPEPWLDPLERRSWLAVNALLLHLPGLLEQQLQRDADLSYFEYLVLAVLAEQDPPRLRMSRLSMLTGGSLSRLSHVAKRLERKNFITREPDPDDRRSTNAILTPAGRAKVLATAPGHVAWVRRIFFDHLGRDDLEQLVRVGGLLTPSIDPSGEITGAPDR